MWIVTQSVVGSDYDAPKEFPIGRKEQKGTCLRGRKTCDLAFFLGTLGVHFKTDFDAMTEQIGPAMAILGRGLQEIGEEFR